MQSVKTHPAYQKTMVPEALRIIGSAVSGGDDGGGMDGSGSDVSRAVEQCIDQGAIDICVSAMRSAEVTGDVDMCYKAIQSILLNESSLLCLGLEYSEIFQWFF